MLTQITKRSKVISSSDEDQDESPKMIDNDIEEQLIDHKEEDLTIGADRNQDATYYIRGNPISLYCTNIATIMGGRAPIWRSGRNNVGIVDHEGSLVSRRQFSDNVSFNDGKLEFATFASLFHIGLCKAKRVAQLEGPFEFTFKDDTKTTTYINIDGEFFRLHNVRRISIQKHFKSGVFKMLRNDND